MDILSGILRIILSLASFLLGFVFFIISGDGYPFSLIILALLFCLISINNGVYLLKGEITAFKKNQLKKTIYNKISIVLILISSIALVLFPVIMFDSKTDLAMVLQKVMLGIVLGIFGALDILKIKSSE
jgi:hypothetical protein